MPQETLAQEPRRGAAQEASSSSQRLPSFSLQVPTSAGTSATSIRNPNKTW